QEADARRRTAEIERLVDRLRSVLRTGLSAAPFNVVQLREKVTVPPFSPGRLALPVPLPDQRRYIVPAPTGLQALNPSARRQHEEQSARARAQFEHDWQAAQAAEAERQRRLADQHQRYLAWVADQMRR